MRNKARAEFDDMLLELTSDCKTFESVVTLVQSEARYLAVKNAVERENRIKLHLARKRGD